MRSEEPGGPDWADTPFVKVYQSLARDYPTVWRDPATLGAYVRLLAAADAVWPAPAELPRGIGPDLVGRLADLGIVEPTDPDGGWYQFHGLTPERLLQASKTARGRAGGIARAAGASRAGGKFAPVAGGVAGALAGDTNGSGPYFAGTSNAGAAGGAPGSFAGDPTLVPATPAPASQIVDTDTSLRSASVSTTDATSKTSKTSGAGGDRNPPRPVPKPSATPAEPGENPCIAPDRHDAEFRYVVGVGWRCPQCDAEAGANDPETFADKVARHGGWVPGRQPMEESDNG